MTEKIILDHHGTPITVGCYVKQRNIFHPEGGALQANAREVGKVTALHRTRISVDFDREAMYGFKSTSDKAPPIRIRADYVVVVENVKSTERYG